MRQEDQEKLRAFNEEWDKQNSTDTTNLLANPQNGNTVQPPSDAPGLEEQLAAAKASMNPGGTYQPAVIPTTGDKCAQCDTMHPPVRPGEICPVAIDLGKVDKDGNPITTQPSQPETPIIKSETPSETPPAVNEQTAQEINKETETPVKVVQQPVTSVQPEPTPLAENNIPTEVHVNKYLNSWGQMIEAHCKTHNIVNVKRLMRHLTVEITDFLEHNKGR